MKSGPNAVQRTATALVPPLAAALLLVAFAARMIALGQASLWYDEAYTAIFARNSISDIVLGTAQLELNTPLHYLALKLWAMAGGPGEFSLRALSAFAGVVTAALAASAVGRKRRAIALALIALSPVAISMSQELRMYALAICLSTAAVAMLFRAQRINTARAWTAWAILSVAAFGAHVLAALVFAAQIPVLLSGWRRMRTGVAAAFGAGAAMLCATLVLAFLRSGYGTTFTDRLPLARTLIESFAATLLPRTVPEAWVAPAAGLAVALLAAGAAKHARMTSVALLTVVLIAFFCVATGKFAARYVTFATPLLLAAASGAQLPRRLGRLAFAAAMLASAAGCIALRILPIYANEDFRGAAQFLRAQLRPDEAVILISGHIAPTLDYYWPDGRNSQWRALPADPVLNVRNALDYASSVPILNKALAGKSGVWLLLWQDIVIDPSNTALTLLRRQAHKQQPDRDIGDFHGLRLLHLTLDAPYRPLPEDMPPMASTISENGPDAGLSALGCHQFERPHAGEVSMEVACFWRKTSDASAPLDTQVSLRLNDRAGSRITQYDQKLAYYSLPYLAFEKPITTFYYVPLPDNLAAGDYTLEIVVYTPSGEISPKVSTPIVIDE